MAELTLILGGAASGKSLYAERLAQETGRKCTYVATAQAFDDEMRSKITAHRSRRDDRWDTIEEPFDVATALAGIAEDRVTLIDCATLWLSNILLADQDVADATDRLIIALKSASSEVIVVSNETGMGIVPEHKLGRVFRAEQGLLNQRLASAADRVVLVVAGLPMVLKEPA